jgi:hypothetical protein
MSQVQRRKALGRLIAAFLWPGMADASLDNAVEHETWLAGREYLRVPAMEES